MTPSACCAFLWLNLTPNRVITSPQDEVVVQSLFVSIKSGVSVIIPARNEAENLPRILDSLPESVDEVIVIDGNSSDDTVGVARKHPRVNKTLVQRSKGKGAALSLGLREASREYVVMIDADGSMNVDEIPNFVAALDSGADVVRGSRYMHGGGSEDLTAFRSFGTGRLLAWQTFFLRLIGLTWPTAMQRFENRL